MPGVYMGERSLAGKDGRTALDVENRDLAAIAAGIFIGDSPDCFGGGEPLLQQSDGFGSIETVGRSLGGYGTDARPGIGNCRAGAECPGFHGNTEFLSGRVPGNDGERGEPGIGGLGNGGSSEGREAEQGS